MSGIGGAHVQVFRAGVLYAEGYTDANGKWSCHLPTGTYLIRISKEGYKTIEKTETVQRSTELIVNLPLPVPEVGKSGAMFLYPKAEVGNPTMLAIGVIITPTAEVATMTSTFTTSVA